MNQVTRWSPVRQALQFDPFTDLEETVRGWFPRVGRGVERALDMRLDVDEDDKAYTVNVDMPGVRKEDIDVSVQGSQVAIRAEINRESSGGKGKQIHSERFSGEAYRAFDLPQEVDAAAARAKYDGGVLTLTLPKKNGSAAKRLPIG